MGTKKVSVMLTLAATVAVLMMCASCELEGINTRTSFPFILVNTESPPIRYEKEKSAATPENRENSSNGFLSRSIGE